MIGLFGKKAQQPSQRTKLAQEYAELTDRLAAIRANFDFAESEYAIDALIYEENAVLARLSALYKQARDSGMKFELYELEKIKK